MERQQSETAYVDPVAILGVCAVALTRIVFRSHVLYDIDSVNFALGMLRFDPATHQPHAPGYFLYVWAARLVELFVSNPNTAMVAVSIGASCGAAYLIYLLAREWFDTATARFSIALFLFSPLGWFHGIVALTYIVEAFFAALIGYLSWRSYSGQRNAAFATAVAFGLAAGFRPSSGLLLAPLWLVSLAPLSAKRRLAAILVAAGVILLWFIPMAEAAGGIRRYMDALLQLWSTAPGRRTTLSSAWLLIARTVTIGFVLVLTFGSASVLAFVPGSETRRARYGIFVRLWIIPALLFFSLVFFNYVNSGYLLLISPPLFALLADRFMEVARSRPATMWAPAVVLGAAINCAIFLWAPLYCSYGAVRAFEQQMKTVSEAFRAAFRPDQTLIVGFDSHFLGYRHAGYYLPEFQVVQYPEVAYRDGRRVFVLQQRSTRLTGQLRYQSFQRFALFPLPSERAYDDYLKGVLAKLPRGAASTTVVAGRMVVSGPVSLLPLLFPATAHPCL